MYQCSFRKGINPQHCFITMLEKWDLSKDKDNSFGALVTKAFIKSAKLIAYGFSRSALKLMYTYLSDRKQRAKISIFYSS